MGVSLLDAQRETILQNIRSTTRGDWKVLVLDEGSKRLLDNVVKDDDILNENITHIEYLEQRRQVNRDVDAVYLLSAKPHIVDCVMADFERRRYRRSNLIWTSLLPPVLRDRIDKSLVARDQISTFKVLNIDFFPRESHVVTFRDPWEFPVLYHPKCNHLVRQQMEDISQKIVGVCVALGEYPIIRYYKSPTARHDASVLCAHLAKFVQDELDLYTKFHQDFPPVTTRPRGHLYITDRSMDIVAPLIHDFTYQAMAFDLLPIRDGDKVTYKTTVNEGRRDQETKDVEITENDKIWTENRHRHMKDTIEKLMGDFQKFIDQNPHFTKQDSENANSLNAIKDMLAGLPQFQEMKEAYSLHLSMAQECMNIFQNQKLPDVASVEQILATGLDEDYRKPKNLTDQVVRTLDDDSVSPPDRLRLLALYLIFRDGLLPADLQKLILHSNLQRNDEDALGNLELLGVQTARGLKDTRPAPIPLFPFKPPMVSAGQEEYSLSRWEPALRHLLSAHAAATLDPLAFPYTKPPLEMESEASTVSATSLRTAKPTWAKKTISSEPRQRVIIYIAGGATYSESRACYEASAKHGKEVVLVTSHMQTPSLFVRQLRDLSADRRRLGLPSDQPQPQAPAHLFERDEPPPPQQQQQQYQQYSQQSQSPQKSTTSSSRSADPRRAGHGGFDDGVQVRPTQDFDRSARMRPPEPPMQAMAGMSLSDPRMQQNGGASPGPGSMAPQGSRPGTSDGKLPSNKLSKDPEKKKKGLFGKRK